MCSGDSGFIKHLHKVGGIAAQHGAAPTQVATPMGTTGTAAVQAGAATAVKKKASLLSSGGVVDSSQNLLGS